MDQTQTLKIRLDRNNIAYLQFVLEGYDGLGRLSTLDSKTAWTQLSFTPDRLNDILALTKALGAEGVIQEVVACEA